MGQFGWCTNRSWRRTRSLCLKPEQVIVEEFGLTPDSQKLELLLEYSESLPEPPARFGDNPHLMERVEECQAPVFIAVEGSPDKVEIFFSAAQTGPLMMNINPIKKTLVFMAYLPMLSLF